MNEEGIASRPMGGFQVSISLDMATDHTFLERLRPAITEWLSSGVLPLPESGRHRYVIQVEVARLLPQSVELGVL